MDAQSSSDAGVFELLAWVEVNKKKLLYAAIAIVIVGLGVYAYILVDHKKEEDAAIALSEAQDSAKMAASGSAAAYLAVAEKHSGTRGGAHALFLAGTSLFSEGKYSDALQRFQEFASKYPRDPLLPQAIFAQGASLEAQQKLSEALAKYQEASQRFPENAVATQAKLAAARVHAAQGRHEQAFKIYRDVLQAGRGMFSSSMMEAQMKMEELRQQHPELEKQMAPPAEIQPAAPAKNPPSTPAVPAKK